MPSPRFLWVNSRFSRLIQILIQLSLFQLLVEEIRDNMGQLDPIGLWRTACGHEAVARIFYHYELRRDSGGFEELVQLFGLAQWNKAILVAVQDQERRIVIGHIRDWAGPFQNFIFARRCTEDSLADPRMAAA